MTSRFSSALHDLEQKSRRRVLALPGGVDLTSNDYLGMATHPALKKAAIMALEGGMDIGAAGSRLLRGHTQAHADLEEYAATCFNAPRSLYFSTGFQANYALLTTLPMRGDVVLYDALIHASMRDGLRGGDAKSYKFAHNDLNALEDQIKRHRDSARALWIVVESLYSMDGDIAPLMDIYALAQRYDAHLIADEAHATGILGEKGKGLCWPIIKKHGYERLVVLHTCGKAIGVAGGLVCASAEIIDYLINAARPFIYSTAPIPLQALLVRKSLDILDSEEGDERRKILKKSSMQAQELFGGAGTHIVPIMCGDDQAALGLAADLQAQGFDIRAIRPPTVPEGTSRLRLSLSVHVQNDVLHMLAYRLELYREEL